jgi:superfamily II DNA helicase RecQ
LQIRVLTLRYSEGLQGFPEDVVKQICAGHEVLDVREHFYVHSGVPHMTFDNTEPSSNAHKKSEKREDPGKNLPEEKQLLYRQLREWRNDKAKTEGIPSYLIFRNSQLAEICQKLPDSLVVLKAIEGIGEATCKKYGKDVLNMLGNHRTQVEQ